MDKEKETMADEQTVQPQEVENGTENKTVRKRISWGRILIATLIILLAGGASGAIGILYYITKDFQTLKCIGFTSESVNFSVMTIFVGILLPLLILIIIYKVKNRKNKDAQKTFWKEYGLEITPIFIVTYIIAILLISFIKNLDTCFLYHIFDIDEIVGSTATCRSCGVRKNVVVCKNLEHQWDNLVVCKTYGMQTMVAYESDYRINTCSACGIRVGTKCPRKHKFGEDQWGTMKCILCGRRLCKVDTDHIWFYERDLTPFCRVCGKRKEKPIRDSFKVRLNAF